MEEIRLTKAQAQKFAQTILSDVEAYAENHLEEYEEFLRNETLGGEQDEQEL